MNNLKELYQDLILDHSLHPKNYGQIAQPTHQAKGNNPLCGDDLTVFLNIDNNIIQDIGFTGSGCAISIASASLMTEQLKGKSLAQANTIFQAFHQLMTTERAGQNLEIGKLQVFENVKNYPMRIKCVTLAWHAFKAALEQSQSSITTENEHE